MRPHFWFLPDRHELVCRLDDKNSPSGVNQYQWMMAPLGDNLEASFLAVVWRDVNSTLHSPKEVLIKTRELGTLGKD